jgi:flagellar biosynthesis component FlhA
MRGSEGVVVEEVRYRDKMQQDRRSYRLTRHGVFVGGYKTREELGR